MKKILVIEDERILCSEVIEWLTLEGYEAEAAEDGMAGVELAFNTLPDLIICDITMPRLDGHGVLLELRANPATADTPFIFVTARASYEDMRTGMDLGADDYITKPFSRLELLRAVQSRLEKKETLEQKRQQEVSQWQQAFEREREQRLLKAKLVAMFSHDFRNPLTTIMSSNSLLRDYSEQLEAERRIAHYNRVDAAARQLLQMLEDMMVVAQMETGSLQFRPEHLNVGSFLEAIIDEFHMIHNDTHRLIYENRFPAMARIDPRLVRQIASNLISNAIKYTLHENEVRVILEKQDEELVLLIQDQGIGIPEADQVRLFNTFQRASNVGNIPGTGLGLAIVKEAVQLHGGTVQLESQCGTGTTVTIRLPV